MDLHDNLWESEETRLLERARQGDQTAVEELFRRHRPRLMGFFKSRLSRTEDAEDMAQEAVISGAAGLPSYRGLAIAA